MVAVLWIGVFARQTAVVLAEAGASTDARTIDRKQFTTLPAPVDRAGGTFDSRVRRRVCSCAFRERPNEQRPVNRVRAGQRGTRAVRPVARYRASASRSPVGSCIRVVLGGLELANGIGHSAPALSRGDYFPGVATTPVLLGVQPISPSSSQRQRARDRSPPRRAPTLSSADPPQPP